MSELRTASVADVAGTGPVDLVGQSAAKAWASINGGYYIAFGINSSFNVSSVTDHAVGDIKVNLTASYAASNPNFTALASGHSIDNRQKNCNAHHDDRLASVLRYITGAGSSDTTTLQDVPFSSVISHGDLA